MRIPLGDLKRAIGEQERLVGSHVDNVYQCDGRTLLLRLQPEKRSYVIDLSPGRARALVTGDPPAVPDRPPTFGAIFRRALRGARLAAVELLGEDRIVALDFERGEERRRVVAELFARHGNLLLLNEAGQVERVLDGAAARHRGNPVGADYSLPDPPKIPAEDSLLADAGEGPFAANLRLDALLRAAGDGDGEARARKERERSLARLRRSRDAVEKDLARLEDPAELRRQGETLLCHYGDLRTGLSRFKGVSLEAKLSPPENIERIFERARKAERARPILEARLAEMDDLLRRAEAGEELPARLLPPSRKGAPQPPRQPFRVFRSLEGARILVGKGGKDNDVTTMRVAGPHDLFLHVRGTPGAHVIVPLDRGAQVGEQTLLDAATLALHYSKMRTAAAADVSYTERKNVSKPRGAKPGLVQVQRERVLRLRREPERLARLLMTAGDEE